MNRKVYNALDFLDFAVITLKMLLRDVKLNDAQRWEIEDRIKQIQEVLDGQEREEV